METYDHKKIEKKWQAAWEKSELYKALDDSKKPKKYVLIEFPYPSGEGLHMGHLRPYLAGDVYSRFNRMQGFETMYPMGWDAFGLPAENYAIKKGVHPSVSTAKNIANAKKQVKSWGMSFDWSREVNTTDPEYYKWTQWIFLQFYKAGLAYEATGLINWCPKDKTGLANEEVIDGKCERCGTLVEKKELRQWYLKITAYAEKLLEGLKTLDWPERVKIQQENWIGKSEGAEIDFEIDESQKVKKFVILHGKSSTPESNYYSWLKNELEKQGFKVESPQLPNPGEPDDEDQADFVQKNMALDEQTVVIGHSFGGIVALRLLERGIRLAGAIVVGMPYSGIMLDKDRPSVTKAVKKGFDAKKIKQNAGYVEILSDLQDHIVPVSDARELAKQLGIKPNEVTASKSHFGNKEEPSVLQAALPRIKVFTTRPDTLFGATYMVLAPEHPLVENLKSSITNWPEIKRYVEAAQKKTDIDRSALEKEKTGVELKGIHAINPATKEKIPVWIADYVLATYGTGAIMAVPAHDERDKAFAEKYNLPIKQVVDDKGKLIDSGDYNGLDWKIAKKKITAKFGIEKIQYKLRDWVFSRQRYWGEPIPLIHCDKCGIVPVPDDELPVKLPEVEKYEPTGTGESPLAGIDSWVNVKCPKCGGKAKRETNTMPQWAGSSWYWLRYTDPKNDQEFADKKLLKRWTPVDVYFGGMEHTTLHLLYSRFWNLFLYDQGLVTAQEAYARRVPHGIVLGPDGEKMSKSRGNIVNPDDLVEKYGADALRMLELFAGPHDATVTLNPETIIGAKRFLDKVWRLGSQPFSIIERGNNVHKLIVKITSDIQNFKFNTAVAAFMEFLNENKALSKGNFEVFLTLLAPFAPHITEELWHNLDHNNSIHSQPWPTPEISLTIDVTVNVVVQVLGRKRAVLELDRGSIKEMAKARALEDENVKKQLEGKEIIDIIFVPDKLINFVVKE